MEQLAFSVKRLGKAAPMGKNPKKQRGQTSAHGRGALFPLPGRGCDSPLQWVTKTQNRSPKRLIIRQS